MRLSFSLSFLAYGLFAYRPVSAYGTTTESITYITPIYEGALAADNRDTDLDILEGMKSMLGVGGAYTTLGFSFSSWALSRDIGNTSTDYAFDPTNLNYVLGLAVSTNLPILVHINDGRWADCCTSNSDGGWNDALLDHISAQPNTTMMDSSGNSLYSHDGGGNFFSFSRLNSAYRSYKQRNVQAAITVLADWAAAHPDLFVGVSLDSETIFPGQNADYNPLTVEEWVQWLRNSGIYGPGGSYFGQGRVPAFTSIESFNQAMGTSFSSWDAVQPPTSITAGQPFSEEWARWRVTLIDHEVADETYWIASAGIDRDLIYGHQTPNMDFYGFADDHQTETAANGASGVTLYGWVPSTLGSIDNPIRGSGKNNFGVFELNPLTTDATTSYNTLLTLYNDGIKVICPNAFENVTQKDQYSLFDSPNYGDTFGNAIKQFLSDHGDSPRNLAPPPWNPGNRIYDLYDEFDSATSSGPDNHLNVTGASGNVIRRTVYSAVGGSITYSTTLPAAESGQRLNFWTSVGVMDGAGSGGAATFQVTVNGSPLFGAGLTLPQNYWLWKRWLPVMVDVTPWAGGAVTVTVTTTGNDYYGWTQWGSPAIYASSSINNNLALNQLVTVSSSDGEGAGWNTSYLTDGNIEGGTSDRNGWSSNSHSSPSAQEWAQVDLGSTTSIGKVVLFSRSDLSLSASTGFPSAFQIKCSNEGSTWTILVNEVDYPGALAGDGQIFTFPSQSARYVRVLATELGGVAQESGYRMQLTEIEVYA
jgi:hypothetical protein